MNNDFEASTSFDQPGGDTVAVSFNEDDTRKALFRVLDSLKDKNSSAMLRAFMYHCDQLPRRDIPDYLISKGMTDKEYNEALALLKTKGVEVHPTRYSFKLSVDKSIYNLQFQSVGILGCDWKLRDISVSHQYLATDVMTKLINPALKSFISKIVNEGDGFSLEGGYFNNESLGINEHRFNEVYLALRYMGITMHTYHDDADHLYRYDFQYLTIDREVFKLWCSEHTDKLVRLH